MSHFFAYLARMKYIQRWGLMRNTRQENLQEHSLQVAMVAHALALLRNRRFGGQLDPGRIALLAVFHDAEEVITGDLPTPIKYFNPQIAVAVDAVAEIARRKLLAMVPAEFVEEYRPLLHPAAAEEEAWKLVKAADRICAYLKCLEEAAAGNQEFRRAETAIRADLDALALPEVDAFLETFGSSFSLTLDELG